MSIPREGRFDSLPCLLCLSRFRDVTKTCDYTRDSVRCTRCQTEHRSCVKVPESDEAWRVMHLRAFIHYGEMLGETEILARFKQELRDLINGLCKDLQSNQPRASAIWNVSGRRKSASNKAAGDREEARNDANAKLAVSVEVPVLRSAERRKYRELDTKAEDDDEQARHEFRKEVEQSVLDDGTEGDNLGTHPTMVECPVEGSAKRKKRKKKNGKISEEDEQLPCFENVPLDDATLQAYDEAQNQQRSWQKRELEPHKTKREDNNVSVSQASPRVWSIEELEAKRQRKEARRVKRAEREERRRRRAERRMKEKQTQMSTGEECSEIEGSRSKVEASAMDPLAWYS
ncbi:hypothetical protein VTO42DRAFT_6962 [Malbranchea cinnamomea]